MNLLQETSLETNGANGNNLCDSTTLKTIKNLK